MTWQRVTIIFRFIVVPDQGRNEDEFKNKKIDYYYQLMRQFSKLLIQNYLC